MGIKYTGTDYISSAISMSKELTKKVLVVEMSMGQMVDDVKLAINCSKPVEFYGRTGGVVPAPADILTKIKEMGGKE